MDTISAKAPIHLSGYQARDREVVDYRMTELPGTGLMFRGPLGHRLEPGSYVACIGAAQTFGCFCERPFPALLGRALGMPALNLGYGGAGPEFFLRQTQLLPYLNHARAVVIQVMSARSQSNSIYDCEGLEFVTLRRDGRRMGAQAAFQELLRGPPTLTHLPLPARVRRKLGNLAARPTVRGLVAEIRQAWVRSTLALLERITAPCVLFWFSKRRPKYLARYSTCSRLFGEFPHLVTPEMLDQIRPKVAGYVQCVTDRCSSQPLFSRFTGEPVTVDPARDRPDLSVDPWSSNHYYPSPEMHEDAAKALLECGTIHAEAANA